MTLMRPEWHEAANVFPLDLEHLDALVEDIRAFGQKVPIEMFSGKVIDGRRRWLACERLGIQPVARDILVEDPIAYVLSLNLHRRQLTPSQLSMVAARARGWYDAQAKARQVKSGEEYGRGKVQATLPEPIAKEQAREAAGRAVGVSGRMVDYATRVLEHGVPELIEAVEQGRIAAQTAAVVANDREEAQREFVARTPKRNYTDVYKTGAKKKREKAAHVDDAQGEPEDNHVSKGVGVRRANEAVDCLKRIPRNDALRARGFQIVTDWIRLNR